MGTRGWLAEGRLVLGLELLGTGVHVAHEVVDDELEPGAAVQPAHHEVDLVQLGLALSAQYGLADAWALELVLPLGMVISGAEFLDASDAVIAGFDSIHHRDETIGGVGDLEVAARWAAWTGEALAVELRFGVSLPFGGVEPDPHALGRAGLRHQHQFLGSGTVDPLLGVDAGWKLEGFELAAWSAARLPLNEGPKGYRASRTVSGGVSARSGLGLDAFTFQLGPELRWESIAQWSGQPSENSGRTEVLVAVGLLVTPEPGLQLHFAAKIPVFLTSEGSQVSQPAYGMMGLRWAIEL